MAGVKSGPEETATSEQPVATLPATDLASGETLAAASNVGRSEPIESVVLPRVERSCYDILGEHGRGGLGRILRARDRRTGRIVAIKEMLHGTPDAAARFAREAMVTANLQHPAIVPVYEVGSWPNGQPFYAMKLVSGHSLEQAIRDARTASDRTALLPHVIQVADALAYAHDQGIVHRDLKPANVLVGDYGETVVIDWGLAKHVDAPSDAFGPANDGRGKLGVASASQTAAGAVLGTPIYMAPEQARGESVGASADVYAIGALLYHVLGGVPPYHGARSATEVVERVVAGPPRSLRELAPALPVELVAIVERAMAHAAIERYPTARVLAEELGRFRAGQLVRAHSYTVPQLITRWVRRHRATVMVASGALIALIVIGIVAITNVVTARDTAEVARGEAEVARADAEMRRHEADSRLIALHTELGRLELVAHQPGRALPYLIDAYQHDPASSLIRLLVGRAAAALPVELAYAHDATTLRFASSDDGSIVVARSPAATAQVWNVTNHRRLAVPGSVAIAHGGSRLASWSGSSLRLLDPAGHVLVETSVAPDSVDSAELAADDRSVVISTAAGVVSVRRIDTLGELHHFETGSEGYAALDPTARTLVVLSNDGALQLWRVGDGRRVATVAHAHTPARKWLVAFARDGNTAATTNGVEFRVWDLATGARKLAQDRALQQLSLSGDGARLATLDAECVVWEVATGKPITKIALDPTSQHAMDLSPDGTRVVTASNAGPVVEWDAATGARLASFAGHHAFVTSVQFIGDGRYIASATTSNIVVWRAALPDVVRTIDHAPRAFHAAYLDDTRIVTVGEGAGGRIIDSTTGQLVAALPHTGAPHYIAPSPDGRLFATVGADAVRIWKRDGTLLRALPGHRDVVRRVDWSPDGTRIATAGVDRTVRVWRVTDGAQLLEIALPAPANTVRWSSDGARLLVGMEAARATLRDAATGAEIAAIELPDGESLEIRLSPDRERAVIVSAAKTAPIISVHDGKPLFEVSHATHILGATWSPDGSTLVTGAADGNVRTWSKDGTLRTSIQTAGNAVVGLAVSPDNRILATGGEDGIVRLWDLATGRLLATLDQEQAMAFTVFHLAWRADGKQISIVGAGTAVRLWDVGTWTGSPESLVALAHCNAWQLTGEALAPAPQQCD